MRIVLKVLFSLLSMPPALASLTEHEDDLGDAVAQIIFMFCLTRRKALRRVRLQEIRTHWEPSLEGSQ